MANEYNKYQKKQLYVSTDNGVSWKAFEPPIYNIGDIIQTNSPDCGYCEPQYRWQKKNETDFVCVNYSKYYREYYQISNDCGVTWNDVEPIQTRAGDLIELNSYDCDYGVTWVVVDGEFICNTVSEIERYVERGTMCQDNNQYKRLIKQISYDGGITWNDVPNSEVIGDLVMMPSPECSEFEFSWNETGNLICCCDTSYKELIYQYRETSNDEWKNVFPELTKRGDITTNQFGICITEMNKNNIFNIGEIRPFENSSTNYFKVGSKFYSIVENGIAAIQNQTYSCFELATDNFLNPTKNVKTLRYGGGSPTTCSPYLPEGDKDYYNGGGRVIMGGRYHVQTDSGWRECYCYIEPNVNSNLVSYIDVEEKWNERYNTDWYKPPFIYPAMTTSEFELRNKVDESGKPFYAAVINGKEYILPYTISECSDSVINEFSFLPNSSTYAFQGKHDGIKKMFVITNDKLFSLSYTDIETALQNYYRDRFDSYDGTAFIYYITTDGIAYANVGLKIKNDPATHYDVIGIRLNCASESCVPGEGAIPVPDPTIFETKEYTITEEVKTDNPSPISEVNIVTNFTIGTPTYTFYTVYDLANQKMLNAITAYYDYDYYHNIIKDDGTMLWTDWQKCRNGFTHLYNDYIICGNYRYTVGNETPVQLDIEEGCIFYKQYAYNNTKVIDITTNQIASVKLPYISINTGNYNGYESLLSGLSQYNLNSMIENVVAINTESNINWQMFVGSDTSYLYTRQINNSSKNFNRFAFVDLRGSKIYYSEHSYTTSEYANYLPLAMNNNRNYYIVVKDSNNFKLRKYQI